MTPTEIDAFAAKHGGKVTTVDTAAFAEPAAKQHKFRAQRCEIDGFKFHSKIEGRRFVYLRSLRDGGVISDLELQPAFILVVNGTKIGKYLADFAYNLDGQRVYEDVKSPATQALRLYRLKRKLVKALYGVEIREISKPEQ